MRAHRMLGVVGVVSLLAAGAACTSAGHRPRSLSAPEHSPAAWSVALRRPAACASVLVLRQGQVLAGRLVGVGRATLGDALFDIGSAAKSLTAVAVLRLVEQRRLLLSSSISRYLPDVPKPDQSITVGELLSHTSGLPENFSSDQVRLSRDAAVRAILRLPRRHPGEFSYSNAGYTLLAAIVEGVSREPFRTFVRRQLLVPTGMTSTGWYGRPPATAVAVHGHVDGRDTGPAGTQAPASWATLGAGGMTSTAVDMGRWLTAITSSKLLSRLATRLMFTPRAPIGQPGASAAYGWVVGQTPAGPIRLVGGDTDYGYTSDLRIFPGRSLETVALSCSTATPANELGHDLEGVDG
jgi:CubicO group peptidase (beta-lactamase class C family)